MDTPRGLQIFLGKVLKAGLQVLLLDSIGRSGKCIVAVGTFIRGNPGLHEKCLFTFRTLPLLKV